MYATCLFCHQPFGANQVLETFPVGRRLAFDARQGRLWVVCRKCEKWSLAPFEERWEAIEDSERLFRAARKRVATDNIGLARLDEGLELVRIGEPLRPEFAAWRYGDQFGRRRRRQIAMFAAGSVVMGAVAVAGMTTGVLVGTGTSVFNVANWGWQYLLLRRRIASIPTPDGGRMTIRRKHLAKMALVWPDDVGGTFGVRIVHDQGETILTDHAARRASHLLLPRLNQFGASASGVRSAIQSIEQAGGPEAYLREEMATHGVRQSVKDWRRKPIVRLPAMTRVGLEMAVNEENERFALEGELALLELEWKEAEEIAAIADKLGIPAEVEEQLERLRRSRTRP